MSRLQDLFKYDARSVSLCNPCSKLLSSKPTICITLQRYREDSSIILFSLSHLSASPVPCSPLYYSYHLCLLVGNAPFLSFSVISHWTRPKGETHTRAKRGDFLSVCFSASKWQGLLWGFTSSSLVNNAAACIHVTAEKVEEWEDNLFLQLRNV